MHRTITSHSRDLPDGTTFPWIADGLAFGGDYSPEQWPEDVWLEDVRLMQQAGVDSVNVGVFSWGLIEVADGVFEFGWLDRVLDLLHEHGIGVNLATPTAAPPMWLLQDHPEVLRVDADGRTVAPGGRLGWSPSSSVFREFALRIVERLAERYGAHPALRMWHVSNELGNENHRCHSAESDRAFQTWSAERHGSLDALNEHWGTAFWGHRYTAFDQVRTPRWTGTAHNPGLLLDFERFSSDALLAHYRAERDVLRRITPDVPITTNTMIQGGPGVHQYATWAREVDLVANDHYVIGADPEGHGELAFSADRTRGIADGQPWLLIEHSTSAVNWQPRNRAKAPGEMTRNSLAHVARGADGVLFFQWRQSTAGSEQFHSAVVPHAGADTKVFREACELGALLRRIGEVTGSTVERARVAIVVSEDAAAALRSGPKPTVDLDPFAEALAFHRAFTRIGVAVDVVPPGTAPDGYALVVLPTVPLVPTADVERLDAWVRAGGTLLVTPFTGIVDDHNRVVTGGHPGALRSLVGARVEEFFPLLEGETVTTSDGSTGQVWTEWGRADGAEVTATFTSGVLAGLPSAYRNALGAGSVRMLSTHLDRASRRRLVGALVAELGIDPVVPGEDGLERVRRSGPDGSWVFAINHGAEPLAMTAHGTDLVSGADVDGRFVVPGGAVAVVREAVTR